MVNPGSNARARSKGDIIFKSVLTPSNIPSSSSQQPPIPSPSSHADRLSSPNTIQRIALSSLPPSKVTPLPVRADVLLGEGYAAGAYVCDSPSVLHVNRHPSSIICQLSQRFSADAPSLSRCKTCSINSLTRAINRIRSRLPPNSSPQQLPTILPSATAKFSRDLQTKKPPRPSQRQRAESSRLPPRRATERYGGKPGSRAPPCSSTSRGKEASTTGCRLPSVPRNKGLDDIETSTSRYGASEQSPS